jgi:hypothetical protein
MSKQLLLLLIIISSVHPAFAYKPSKINWDYNWDIKAHDKGQLHFQFGVGAQRTQNRSGFYKASIIFDDPSLVNISKENEFGKYGKETDYGFASLGPLTARLQYGFSRNLSISLGATYVNYWSYWNRNMLDSTINKAIPFEYGVKVNNYSFTTRLDYHLLVRERWDVYCSGGIGYDVWQVKDYTKYPWPETPAFKSYYKIPPPITFDAGFGARYFILKRTALFAEIGYGKSYMNLGVAIKVIQPKNNRLY